MGSKIEIGFLVDLYDIFYKFPEFYKWVQKKKLTSRDLSILTEIKKESQIKSLLSLIELYNPTYSEGLQILEWGGEILLMEKSIKSLASRKKTFELIEDLKKLRHPETSLRDEQKSQTINSLNWPSSFRAQWMRKGDRGGVSIRFEIFSLKDLKQRIQHLESVYKKLEKTKLWKE